jgi:hypothetical protein
VGILALLRRHALEALAGTLPLARADLDRVPPWPPLGALLPVGWRGTVRSRHPVPRGEAGEEEARALPAAGAARAATLPRGTKRHPRRHTPNKSCRVPRQSRVSGLASLPRCHPLAIAATSDAWRSSTPIAARAGHHTSDSQ